MTKHKSTQFISRRLNLYKTPTQQDLNWLLRSFFVSSRQQLQAGFVLPTTALVLLIMGLTVTALIFRSLSRTNQVIGQRQQQEIYNAATPAIDRAKAKLENLFTNDKNYPAGVPPENILVNLMRNDASGYTLPGERRLDVNGDGTLDNAWVYDDVAGNKIAYSITMKAQGQLTGTPINIYNTDVKKKAQALVTRTGPVSTAQPTSACLVQATGGTAGLENDWFKDSSSSSFLRKNFQVNAVVINTTPNAPNQTVATLEFQQERKIDRGNKWGAWFRNDLEIFPGPVFNWNGAMHTEGTVFLGNAGNADRFRGYLISSPSSCLYGADGIDASEISMNLELDDATGNVIFGGHMASASMKDNAFLTNAGRIHRTPTAETILSSPSDSVLSTVTLPTDIALDPLFIVTENKNRARNSSDPTNAAFRDKPNWDNSNPLATGTTQRVFNKQVPKPYVDDSYRADNRYGPKVSPPATSGTQRIDQLPLGKTVGSPILAGDLYFTQLTNNVPPAGNPEDLGLDGYWERRARNQGLRVIVGQRLELGNPLAVPPTTLPARPHEALQRRALKDNLAAVQGTAVYFHRSNTGDVPVACVASTVHPGTATILRRSATFQQLSFRNSTGVTVNDIYNDFFTGWGTNGWEYNVPNPASFPTASHLKALNNLGFYLGDPKGAYPAQQEAPTSTIVHPYLELTRHGDFSNLRRALLNLNTVGYANLSIADKSYIDSAACSLGMLAHQLTVLRDYTYAQNTGAGTNQLLDDLNTRLGTTPYNTGTALQRIAALETAGLTKEAQLARLVYMKEQVEWDRLAPGAANPGCALTGNLANLCPSAQTLDSALYYLFPLNDHAEGRTDAYIISASVNPTTVANRYRQITDTIAGDLDTIRLTPRPLAAWVLPSVDVTNNTARTGLTNATNPDVPNDRNLNLIKFIDNIPATPVPSVRQIALKDSAFFNGREMMNVRVLNFDLDLLRRNGLGGDTWLPASGIIYAFREDAVREDAIARPAIGTWANYKTAWSANTAFGPPAAWRMNASSNNAATRKDPPVNGLLSNGTFDVTGTGVSPKAIDYYPDPDRRPYGFRLRQGQNLLRTGADNTNGMSFVSDNPVYIQGDFNLHQNSGGTLLEEFSELLTANWSNFYTRSTLNTDFARAGDSWRPTEVLADTITIMSNTFCEGSVEDGFMPATANTAPSAVNTLDITRYGCAIGNGVTSYLNQNRPTGNVTIPLVTATAPNPQREIPTDQGSPLKISENGAPNIGNTGAAYTGNYQAFTDGKPLNAPATTRINTIIVSGTVASRAQQSYGGLHNFPRFIESWGSIPLYISGSFIQLSFSSYATGPFDQDDWEPQAGLNPVAAEPISYYGAPDRRWGYDVGLQYQPAGAVSRRFTTPSAVRSEFYKELPVDDPYIVRLRCANDGGSRIDPKANCS